MAVIRDVMPAFELFQLGHGGPGPELCWIDTGPMPG